MVNIIVTALLNSIWQALVIVALVFVILKLVSSLNAATRYWIWGAALLALVAMAGVSSSVRQTRPLPTDVLSPQAKGLSPTSENDSAAQSATALSERVPVEESAVGTSGFREESPSRTTLNTKLEPLAGKSLIEVAPGSWLVALYWAWLVGVGLMALRLVRGLRYLLKLKCRALKSSDAEAALNNCMAVLRIRRPLQVRCSPDISVPMLAGFIRPVILIPTTIFESLSSQELHSVIMHELAHLQRRDHWLMLIQRLIEALLFFNPVVWWIGRHLSIEREIACDERVVFITGETKTYANCLLKLIENDSRRQRPLIAPGAIVGRGQAILRIERLLARDVGARFGPSLIALLLTMVILLSMTLTILQLPPVLAVTGALPLTETPKAEHRLNLRPQSEEAVLATPVSVTALKRQITSDKLPGPDETPASKDSVTNPQSLQPTEGSRDIQQDMQQDSSLEALIASYDSTSEIRTKRRLIAVLGRTRSNEGFRKLILIAQLDSQRELYADAISYLGGADNDATKRLIEVYEGTKNFKTRELVISYFQPNSNATALKKMIALAQTDPDLRLRTIVISYLTSMGGDAAAVALIAVYDGISNFRTKESAISYMASNKTERAVEKLRAIASGDSNPALRASASAYLASIGLVAANRE